MTNLRLPPDPAQEELYPDPKEAFFELIRLASFARAMDPSLPSHMRLYQRSLAEDIESGQAPARVLFTNDTRSSLEDGIQDPNVVDLFDALERTLPESAVEKFKGRLRSSTSALSPSQAVEGAFSAASKAGYVSLETRATHDPEVKITSSQALVPPVLAFRENAFLNSMVLSNFTRMRLPGEDPVFDYVSKVNSVRQALSRDASTLSAAQISRVVEAIRELDEGVAGSFESTHGQGWLAYSALSGGKGWTAPLLKGAPESVSPHTSYHGISPMAASVVANDPQAVQALLEQGVSPNVYLDSVPRAMNHVQHEVLSEKLGERFTLASLAAAMGNAASLGVLARGGALVNAPGEDGKTPLHHAVESGSEAAVRALINNGANPNVPDARGATPRMMAQGSLKQVLEATSAPESPQGTEAPVFGGIR